VTNSGASSNLAKLVVLVLRCGMDVGGNGIKCCCNTAESVGFSCAASWVNKALATTRVKATKAIGIKPSAETYHNRLSPVPRSLKSVVALNIYGIEGAAER